MCYQFATNVLQFCTIYDGYRPRSVTKPAKMGNGRIEIPYGSLHYKLKMIPEVHVLLADYARIKKTTMVDAGNRIFSEYFTAYYGYKGERGIVEDVRRAIFSNDKSILRSLVSVIEKKLHGPRRKPLRKDGKLPFPSTESDSCGQDSP